MDRRALTRLRVAFLLLGAALLLPLGLLLRSVDTRMEAQRHLRHELVAERIFDEMEGELTALLQREDARPSDAYAGTSTRVENWAPFVVGYFTRDARGVQIVAKPQLANERLNRLETALKNLTQRGDGDHLGGAAHSLGALPSIDMGASPAPSAASGGETLEKELKRREDKARGAAQAAEYEVEPESAPRAKGFSAASAPAAGALEPVKAVPEAIIKQLNRAADVREREAPSSKRKAMKSDDSDPLGGLE